MSLLVRARTARSMLRAVAAVASAGLVLAACPDEPPDTVERSIAVYGSVLSWVLDHEVPVAPAVDGEPPRVVFVEHFGSDMDLQVQVELVSRFEQEGYELRFVDTRLEALDEGEDDRPVRDGGVLVGLGPIPKGIRIEVRVEVYRSQSDIDAYRVPVAHRTGTWGLAGEPTPVEPEGFVTVP
jgi:hypothetical protein